VTDTLKAYNLTVNPGASLTFRAGKRIVIGHGTHIKSGSHFRAYIDTVCSTTDAFNSARAEQVKIKNKGNTKAYQQISLYPNPTSDLLYVETPYELNYEIYDVLGNKIASGTANTGKNEINVSEFPVGMYIIKTNKGKIFKFVKVE